MTRQTSSSPMYNLPGSAGPNSGSSGRTLGADCEPQPFWIRKSLYELSQSEWEALCDGCGRCCLNKLEDYETGEIAFTNVACRLLDSDTCRCRDYSNRLERVPDCLQLDPDAATALTWLPPTCGYRLVAEGRPLYWWHPLLSGSRDSVHEAGISVRGRTLSEAGVPDEDLIDHVVKWPGEDTGSPTKAGRIESNPDGADDQDSGA